MYDGNGQAIEASKMLQDIAASKEAERLQNVLIGERNHRVMNVFATVMAISRQTVARNGSGREEVASFDARLTSMAHAHHLLAHNDWQRADLADLVKQVLEPDPPESFEIDGCSILLPQKAVVSFALAIHELATTAARHGAMSVPDRVVAVKRHYAEATGRLALRWVERKGPAVVSPTRRGFGSQLIERLLAAELNGNSRISYDPVGVICEIDAQLPSET